MPCYEVRTVSVEFKVGNIDLLKKALEKIEMKIFQQDEKGIAFEDKNYNIFKINLINSRISGPLDEKGLGSLVNSIKRSYSEQVIDEIAKKQKWLKKKMGENRYQLQRF
jgi:hypothetical protein